MTRHTDSRVARVVEFFELLTPADVARIAIEVATLRGIDLETLATINRANAIAALPRLEPLLRMEA